MGVKMGALWNYIKQEKGWIGFDLDGTLAIKDFENGNFPDDKVPPIGEPIESMINIVKEYINKGENVKIFSARVSHGSGEIDKIKSWCLKHIGIELDATNVKDPMCKKIYDDIAVQVIKNKGIVIE